MKLILITLILVGLAMLGAKQVSYFADPALKCQDIKVKINKTHTILKEQEKRLQQLRSDQSITADLTRQQFTKQYQRHVRLFKELEDIFAKPEGRKLSECNPTGIKNRFITYDGNQIKALGIKLPNVQ